ncbi:MAG: hypothetical protein ACQKBT_01505, partial [Puniceicoccales bacterium]
VPFQFIGIREGVTAPRWMVVGPFGGPGIKEIGGNLKGKEKKKAVQFYKDQTYPIDGGHVDPEATFSGPMIEGYWKKNDALHWKEAEIEGLDTRVKMGHVAQLYFGTTAIYSPEEAEVELVLQGHNQTYLTWWINGEEFSPGPKEYRSDSDRMNARRLYPISITLQKGWNQIVSRGFCVGYNPYRVGVVVKAPSETLWKLKFSPLPTSEF